MRSDALAQARREFGSSARVREGARAAWQFSCPIACGYSRRSSCTASPRCPACDRRRSQKNGPLGSRSNERLLEVRGGAPVQAAVDWITPGFFETIGLRRMADRDFTAGDAHGAPPVVIVNAVLSRALFNKQHHMPDRP
jgi:hypothetical protein